MRKNKVLATCQQVPDSQVQVPSTSTRVTSTTSATCYISAANNYFIMFTTSWH